eukprot:5757009-Prymnesium_polylepis.1
MSHLRGAAAARLHLPAVPVTAAAVTPSVRDDHDENASVVSLRDYLDERASRSRGKVAIYG